MAENTTTEVGVELRNPQLAAIAKRILRKAELAAEKIAANHAEPARYPLATASDGIEAILAPRFKTLPTLQKKQAGERALARLTQPSRVRATRFSELMKVDLQSQIAIDLQAAKLLKPISFDAAAKTALMAEVKKAPLAAPPPPTAYNRVALRIRSVRCEDETNGAFGLEAGDDEISMGGTVIDESGDTNKVAAFMVRDDFDDNEQKTYNPPRTFASFSITEGGNHYPKSYFATVVLSEVDNGGFPSFLNQLTGYIRNEVKTAIQQGLSPEIGPELAAIVAEAVAWVLNALFNLLASIWGDDQFAPAQLRCNISNPDNNFQSGTATSSERWIRYKGHGGQYLVKYDWHLTK